MSLDEVIAGDRQDAGELEAAAECIDSDRARDPTVASLYETHAVKLMFALRKTFGDGPPDPEDVVQRAFEKLLSRNNHSDIRDLPSFLWRIARNIVISDKRAHAIRTRHDYEIEHLYFPRRGDNLSPEGVLRSKQQLKVINEALRVMPDRRRRAFILHKIDGLSVSDVARELGIGRSPAVRHIQRASHAIAASLASETDVEADG